ncbi:hypothetical protein [Paraburkholderia dipogonis]
MLLAVTGVRCDRLVDAAFHLDVLKPVLRKGGAFDGSPGANTKKTDVAES